MTSQISNPFSAGGGGQFFEAKVQARFLLQLLVGGPVPCLPSGSVQSIRLQAKQAGYNTDDVVVTICTGSGTEHWLLAQIKHHAAITVSDADFYDSMVGAWSDFNNPSVFVKGRDALALITGPHSDRTLHHVRPLLDWARTSSTSTEFVGKVATALFSSKEKREYLEVFRAVLAKISETELSDDILWQFLKHFYLLSYDFDVQASKDEAAALTAVEMAQIPSSGVDAQAIWESLIVQAQEWNKTAGTITLKDFPERIRSAVQSRGARVRQTGVLRLQEHGALVLGDINTELAPGIRLPRAEVLDVLVDTIESSRIIVVQGAPGTGKSAAVKILLEALPSSIVSFAFKAQELNHPHVHQFLTSLGVHLSLEQLRSEFALLPRKLLLVDGAERLFELSCHEAFRHLLQQLENDESWTVVITCRESSAELLREHLLAQWDTDVVTVTIPSLGEGELEWVSGQLPPMGPLIANPQLARLLQNLFILSLASKTFRSALSSEAISNIDERQFKDIVWRDYVERASKTQGGLPTKRERCFLSVSVERARRMSLFVSSKGLDAEAVQTLLDDGILIKSKVGSLAPAHDVLEDWAVLRFIAQEFEAKSREPSRFLEAVGMEPAMRRGFRLWLSDALAARDNQPVMDFVLSSFKNEEMQPVWRDEISVSVLQSENAGEFIKKVESLLLGNNKAFYKRLVHVLRTACKGPNESMLRQFGLATFRSHEILKSVFVVPVGSGWRELIFFTWRNIDKFDLNDAETVLGLLKDWTQGLSVSEALPTEARAAALLCLKYWGLLAAPNLYADRMEEEFLRLLFKIPHAVPDEITAIIQSAILDEFDREYQSRTVLEHVTKTVECQPLCQHFPDLVIEVAEKIWRLQPKDRPRYGSFQDLEELFGFAESLNFEYPLQSAWQGPFMFLLAHHPEAAVDFIVRLANQAALSYSKSEIGDEVCTIQLPTATGSRPVIASPRLWALYRGMMPGPHVLECALMSLESWLLNQAKEGIDIRGVFRKICDASTSAATLAALASVAVAYPGTVMDEVLPLLAVQEFIRWDSERSRQERFYVTDLRPALGIPTGGVEDIYYRERKDSDALSHRKSNLEELTFRLQWTTLQDSVHSILDNFYKELPPVEDQSEADRVWRIALHRMDARHIKIEQGKEPGQILFVPGECAPDLQQYIAKVQEEREPMNRGLLLSMWAIMKFRRKSQPTDPFPDWRDALHEAQEISGQPSFEMAATTISESGPCFVAAYLLRDHYDELEPSELQWCRRLVIEEVLRKDTDRTLNTRISKNSYDGSRPSALVLPLLLKSATDTKMQIQIEECLAVAVTHISEEVRDYAAVGVRDWLWEIDPKLAKACVGGLLELSGIESQIRRKELKHLWNELSQKREEEAVLRATTNIRARIAKRETLDPLSRPAVDLEKHHWPELLDALGMIDSGTNDPDLRAFVMACLNALLGEAEAAEAWQSHRRGRVHHEFRYGFARLFAQFALARPVAEAIQITQLLSEHIDRCPNYLGDLIDFLPYEEDRVHSDKAFWSIWRGVSDIVFKHKLLRGHSRIWRYNDMSRLVRILLFANMKWKEGVREWEVLNANKDFIEYAVSLVGDTPAGFEALLTLLNSVGKVFLPDSIKWLAESMVKSGGTGLLDSRDVEFELETLLRNVCYGYSTTIRQRPDLHRAVISLLDKLVERGSHTGFRIRDYIISPLPQA